MKAACLCVTSTYENVEKLCLALSSLFRWLQSSCGYLYICNSVGCQTLLSIGNELVNQMMWGIVMFVNSKSGFRVGFFILECIARIARVSILGMGFLYSHVLDTDLHHYQFGQFFIYLSWEQQTKTHTERVYRG